MNKKCIEFYENETDRSLCTLNKEIASLKQTRRWFWGDKAEKLSSALKRKDFAEIKEAIRQQGISRELAKISRPNENFLTYDPDLKLNGRIAVYTCITGGYDGVREPLYQPENVDYFIVTDHEVSPDSRFKKIDINSIKEIQGFDNTRKARYIKTHPHVLFPDYEYSVWVDGNFKIIGDIGKYYKCTNTPLPMASNWHPDRNSIYTELTACKLWQRDNIEKMENQVNAYKEQGMPDDFGLIETNVIVRRHNDPNLIKVMEDWWTEISTRSLRDQLSLPYVLWKNGYSMHDLGFIAQNVKLIPGLRLSLHTDKD